MLRILIFLLTSLISIHLISQTKNVDINRLSLSDYIDNEKEFVGGKILNERISTIFEELSQFSYIRQDNSVPDVDLIVRYIFYKNDSLLKEIRYEWDVANHNDKLDNQKDVEFRKALFSFYSLLEKKFEIEFGKSEIIGRDINILKLNNFENYKRTNKWLIDNTEIKLNLEMSNTIDKESLIFPTHQISLVYRALKLKGKMNFKNKELLFKERKEIPNIENPTIGSFEPIYPGCAKKKDKFGCMYNKIQELIINEVKDRGMFIENDTLKVEFMIGIDGKLNPTHNSVKSNNKELEIIGFSVLENIPYIQPSYSDKTKQNVSSGNSFYFIIKNNEVTNKFNADE